MIASFLDILIIVVSCVSSTNNLLCDLLVDERIECGFMGIKMSECISRGCCWVPFSADDPRNPPWCCNPSLNECGIRNILESSLINTCNNTMKSLNITVSYPFADTLRVKIMRTEDEFVIPNWITPDPINNNNTSGSNMLKYTEFNDSSGKFNFKIERHSDSSKVLWDTNLNNGSSIPYSSIRMEYMYTQIGTLLPANHSIYGLGYHAGRLKQDPGTRIALYARDSTTIENQNLYGAHPFYLQIIDGLAHGVYLRNSHGMDVIINKKEIKFKILGGPIDLFFFAGPSPLDVINQYTRIIGRPAMFDFRSFGFHQSRYGYSSIDQINHVIDQFRKYNIPLETIWLDIDYMHKKRDFTIDPINFPVKKMKMFLEKLKSHDQRAVFIIDPGIAIDSQLKSYNRGIKSDVFIKNPKGCKVGKYYIGQVWPGRVHFIDFTYKNASEKYWTTELSEFFALFPDYLDTISGIWLDMNEPSNFINGYNYTFTDLPSDWLNYSLNFPRYMVNNGGKETPIYSNTVPMDAESAVGKMYSTHNLYGICESIVTFESMSKIFPGKRPFLLSRSTFPGSGKYTATWLGDNYSTFRQMAISIPGVLQYGILGIPLSGPDICGFLGDSSEELCARWMALGSFYPFARNHNAIISNVEQEPFRWKSVGVITKKYFALRYSLHPYWYTLMFQSNKLGWPYWRPVFFYDPSKEALNIDDQFFLGESFLITPVLEKSQTSMTVRIPPGEWYDWHTKNFTDYSNEAVKIVYSTPIDYIPIHLKAGSIIPMQTAKTSLKATRATPLSLLIALNSSGSASGDLYWDDGTSAHVRNEFIDLTISSCIENNSSLRFVINSRHSCTGCAIVPSIEKITVYTAGNKIFSASVNNTASVEIIYNNEGFEVYFKNYPKIYELENTYISF